VKPTFGHVRDLPRKELGVDAQNNFKPKYVRVKKRVNSISDIKKAADSAEIIYLAADPDREGEAIAWHVYQLLPAKARKKCKRVIFREITKEAIQTAISKPRELDMHMVNSQQARRILDRLVGFEVSPMLWKQIRGRTGLSAGRVQSAALKLLYDRREEIQEFEPEEYFTIHGVFDSNHGSIETTLNTLNGKPVDIRKENEAEKIVEDISGGRFWVEAVE